MGCSIQLVRLNDFISDVDSIDLSTGGYSLANDGYFQSVAPIGAKSVHEVITLKLQGSSKDNLAVLIQDIDEKIKQVQWWLDDPNVERYQVWLRVQLDGETYSRQAQILNILPPDKVRTFTPTEINNNYIGEYQIGIERTPFWEDPYPYPNTTAITALSSCGGMAQMSETISGDVPARIAVMNPTPNGSDSMGEYWIGFKSDRFGNPANFEPVWSLSESEYLDTDTTASADATAVNGNKLTCTFGTVATLKQRTITLVSDIVADTAKHNDQRGTYQVLLRARMSDTSSTARVRMLYSFAAGDVIYNPIYRNLQTISSPVSASYWKLYPMGIAVLPSMKIISGLRLTNAAISLQAERISGAGSLIMDCLVLIPIDDSGVHVATGLENTTNGEYLRIIQDANGNIRSFGSNSVYITYPTAIDPMRFSGLVANGSKPYIVVAGQKYVSTTSQNTFTEKIDVTYTYIPRWRTLRGNST